MDLSIIIVSWNVRRLLLECLDSIYANPPAGSFEVWVVDNASQDDTPQAVREHFPGVQLIENKANAGFARANNQAIECSTGRYALLLNPDTQVFPDSLDALVSFLDEHPQAAAAGSHLLNPDRSLQPACFPFPTLAREFWRLFRLDRSQTNGAYDMTGWDMRQPRPVEVIQGTSLALRRAALDQVGLLDESYFVYTEEVDLCYRLHQAGWQLYWIPQSRVMHYGGQSTQQVAQPMFVSLYRTKTHFFRKHYGRASAFFYRLILLVASAFRLALSPLAWLEPPAKRERHLKMAANYLHLIRVLPGL